METVLRRLMEIEGVLGVLLAGKDGLVVASTLDGEEEELLGAMAAACFDSTSRYIEALGMGSVHHALFEMPGGTVQIADGGELLVVVKSTQQAGLGRIRMELAQTVQRLAHQPGAY